jgi:hypothetical protein
MIRCTMKISDQYAAGLIEARGRMRKDSRGRHTPPRMEVSVLVGDKQMAQALQDHFEAGEVEPFHPRSNPQIELWFWTVRGAAAKRTLERTAPYMVGYLRESAEALIRKAPLEESLAG